MRQVSRSRMYYLNDAQRAEMARALHPEAPLPDNDSLMDILFHLQGDVKANIHNYLVLDGQLTAYLKADPQPTDAGYVLHIIHKNRMEAEILEHRTAMAFHIFHYEVGKVARMTDEIYKEVVAVKEWLHKVEQDVHRLATSYDSMAKQVERIGENVEAMQVDITRMQGDIGLMKADIRTMKTDISDLKKSHENLERKVDNIADNVGEIKEMIAQLSKQVQSERQHSERFTWMLFSAFAEEAKFSEEQMGSVRQRVKLAYEEMKNAPTDMEIEF
ncbi:uncharacterized protein LOC129598569 [Paramacrobiotus metropolitanus]|uniref:uncharacterized protein LOC129598569 n=1 Tax=Paramacrobiotus metropolitanus TaxID=2943436 RepID=UPI0024458052|nr:uncharacterized protein LOC129598569 [Paramacrobiotus metropolitanus]